jgi:hypothetical protein
MGVCYFFLLKDKTTPIAEATTTIETIAIPAKNASLDMFNPALICEDIEGVGAVVWEVVGAGVGVSGIGVWVVGGVGVMGAFTSIFIMLLAESATLAFAFETVVPTILHLPVVSSVLETVNAPVFWS